MAKAPHSYDFFPGDYAKSTRAFNLEHHGMYRVLLDEQWEHGSVPKDPAQLMAICGLHSRDHFNKLWEVVQTKFVLVDGKLINERMKTDRIEAIKRWKNNKQIAKMRVEAGKQGAKRRWQTDGKCHSKPIGKGMANLEGEGEVEVEVNKKNVSSKAKPKDVAEVVAYISEMGYGLDAHEFWDGQEARGWVTGKARTPVKDWKASVRTWERYRKDRQTGEKKQKSLSQIFQEEVLDAGK